MIDFTLGNNKISMLPDFSNTEQLIMLLIIPLAVQWWSAWYPGSEPGGGGYIAQRMIAAKDENHAIRATLFFNIKSESPSALLSECPINVYLAPTLLII